MQIMLIFLSVSFWHDENVVQDQPSICVCQICIVLDLLIYFYKKTRRMLKITVFAQNYITFTFTFNVTVTFTFTFSHSFLWVPIFDPNTRLRILFFHPLNIVELSRKKLCVFRRQTQEKWPSLVPLRSREVFLKNKSKLFCPHLSPTGFAMVHS